jgi:prepilin-type N-terminal cleavage/methylation domain-containing protein
MSPPINDPDRGQDRPAQALNRGSDRWSGPCYLMGMRSERGYTLVEVLITLGLIGVVTAISVPVFIESNARSKLWTGSEQIGAEIRQARLKAISSNTTYRVVFDCPAAGQLRSLVMTGDPAVDDDPGRCNDTLEGDSGTIQLPSGVGYDADDEATGLQVTGRGVFTAMGGAIPLMISVTYGPTLRTLTVSATGQITFSDVE